MKGYETMKATKKLLALVLAVVMIMAMAVTASAASTATVTIENAQKGSTYTFYKLFEYDETNKWYKVIGTDEWKAVIAKYFSLDTNGYILGKNTALTPYPSDSELAAALVADMKALDSANVPSSTTVTAGDGTTNATLELGYYLMTSTLGGDKTIASLAMITKDGLKIREKNTPDGLPKIEKTYADGSTGGSYSIGDIVEFKIVITVEEGATKYTVHDKAQDLDIDLDHVDYSIVTSTGATVTGTVKKDALGDDCSFHIVLEVSEALKAYDTITIKYKATVTDENPSNKAWLDKDPGTDDPGTSSYNYGFTVEKTNGEGTKLSGAEFVLSRNTDGKFATFADGKLTGWVATADAATKLTSGADGTFTVSGLAAGDYTLTEITAPIGYKKLDGTINVKIQETIVEGKPTGDYIIKSTADSVSGSIVTVINTPIDPLPETGGMGTTMFYMLGGLMAAAALVLLTSKKRMAA